MLTGFHKLFYFVCKLSTTNRLHGHQSRIDDRENIIRRHHFPMKTMTNESMFALIRGILPTSNIMLSITSSTSIFTYQNYTQMNNGACIISATREYG